ncbi:MAG: hypothetical protein OEM67_05010 [Thermoleophilia bacterium]|nr:hypothetical protein [Thermoleophilia bacterium]MDH3724587.1 hypothetical protein [Thermoleophilia bacterium]
MAKRRKRRRPKAGPQPVKHPGREVESASEKKKDAPVRREPDAPRPVSYKGLAIRAGIVAALFYPYLLYIGGESPSVALIWTVIAFAIMMPVGIAIDHVRYRLQRKRYDQRVSGAE